MNIRTKAILIFICVFAVILNVVKKDAVPACMNADEAAFGYNAYSILKTGKDEYGTPLPLRLKSFGDFKMPLYSYLSVPFISVLGLNETGTRSLNTLVAFLFPAAMFFLARELFKNDTTALLASFLAATSLGLAIVGRQAHEAYITALLTVTSCLFFLRWLRLRSPASFGLLFLSLFFLLLGYQSARIFAVFFFLFAFYESLRKRLPLKHMILLTAALIIFSVPDFLYKPARVSNLLFFTNPGIELKTRELRTEGGIPLIYNKVSVAATQFLGQHLLYYSPQFRKKERSRYFLIWLLIITPLAGSLSWAGASITRTLFLFPLTALIAGYGFIEFLKTVPKKKRSYVSGATALLFFTFLFYSWNFYLSHYNKRLTLIAAQQCGYKELGNVIKSEYPKTDTIYITKENGEPYIFTLFYRAFDPATYQTQARLSKPDQYGFGQVESYDKFIFHIPSRITPNSIVVGTPEDFKNHESLKDADQKKIRKIRTNLHEDFWVYKP
jgi:4-amino-4-deoxy-L-arabinose transferase-like glycosyltransferase